MPSGVPSAILFAILIGAALLVLIPALISGSGAEAQDRAEQELAESPMRVLDRGKKSPAASDVSESGAAGDSATESDSAKADVAKRDAVQQRRALEFVEKLARTTTLDVAVQREVVAWLATSAQHRDAPSAGVVQVLASADKEPYRSGGAWLVRGAARQRPRLVAVPRPPARDTVAPPSSTQHRRAA